MTSYQYVKLWIKIYMTKVTPIMDIMFLVPLAILVFILFLCVAGVALLAYAVLLIANVFLGWLAIAMRVIMAKEI